MEVTMYKSNYSENMRDLARLAKLPRVARSAKDKERDRRALAALDCIIWIACLVAGTLVWRKFLMSEIDLDTSLGIVTSIGYALCFVGTGLNLSMIVRIALRLRPNTPT